MSGIRWRMKILQKGQLTYYIGRDGEEVMKNKIFECNIGCKMTEGIQVLVVE